MFLLTPLHKEAHIIALPNEIEPSELEEKLRAALAEPGAVLDFYRALLGATLFVGGQAQGEDGFNLNLFLLEGNTVFSIFTSRERCEGYFPDLQCFTVTLHAMLPTLPKDSHILVNPDDPEYSYVFNDLLVQALLTGAMFRVDEQSFNGAFYTGPLQEPKAALKKLLRDILSRHEQVEAAFMTVLYQPHSAYTPHPAVGLACDGDPQPALQHCAAEIKAKTEDRVALYAMGNDALSHYAARNTSPFYWKSPPVPELPEPLPREALIALLKAMSDKPSTANSMFQQYLNAEPTDNEARAAWFTLDPQERIKFKSFENFFPYYLKMKKQEIEHYRAFSTHAEARRVFLDALTKDGRFCLFLHDFAGEATQRLKDVSGTGLKRIQLFTLPERAVDDPLRRFLRSLPCPAAGVANPQEAIRPSPVVPLLELADSEWVVVVVSLIALAESIVLVVENNPGHGLLHELFAIQKLSREDQTLILVPDEESEQKRRKTLDIFASFEGHTPTNTKPMASALLGLLSTYGLVETWSEFARTVEHMESNDNP